MINNKQVCDNILPTLLRYLDKVEHHFDTHKYYGEGYGNYDYQKDYDSNNYYYDNYEDSYKSNEIEKFEILRNIAYTVCP